MSESRRINFSDISFPVMAVVGMLPMLFAAVVSFTVVKVNGQQTEKELIELKSNVKDTIIETRSDHDKLIVIYTTVENIKVQQDEFKRDLNEIKNLLKKP